VALKRPYLTPFGIEAANAYWYIISVNASRLGRQVGWRIVAYVDQAARAAGSQWLPGSERDYRVNGPDADPLLLAIDGGSATAALYVASKSLLAESEAEMNPTPTPYFADAEDV
jgi:hypothetical protein